MNTEGPDIYDLAKRFALYDLNVALPIGSCDQEMRDRIHVSIGRAVDLLDWLNAQGLLKTNPNGCGAERAGA